MDKEIKEINRREEKMKVETKTGIETVTKTGTKVEIKSESASTSSPNIQTTIDYIRPCGDGCEVRNEIHRGISKAQGQKGIWGNSFTLEGGKSVRPFLAFNNSEIKKIEKYFAEINELEKDIVAHWTKINLGVCINSKSSYHWWVGDIRTPYEQIVKEASKVLMCCYKLANHEAQIKKAYDSCIKEWEEHNRERKLAEEKRRLALEEAKATQKPVLLSHYSVMCNDLQEECSVDNISVYVMPDGNIKEERNHTW